MTNSPARAVRLAHSCSISATSFRSFYVPFLSVSLISFLVSLIHHIIRFCFSGCNLPCGGGFVVRKQNAVDCIDNFSEFLNFINFAC